MINFSAKDLCSKSAKQIKYLRDNPNKRKVSQFMIDGSNFQQEQFEKIPNALYSEMCGCYNDFTKGINIYFSNDIITNNSIIEIKHVLGNYEDWFLKNSLLQCAFYKSLIMIGNTTLKTASFLNKPKEIINVSRNIDYFLKFGNKIFKIEVKNPLSIIKFFLCKAEHTMTYEDAANFDKMYKRKEYEILSNLFTFKEIRYE